MVEQQKEEQYKTNVSSNPLSQLIERMKPLHVLLGQLIVITDLMTQVLKR